MNPVWMARDPPHTKSCRAQRGNRQGGLAERRRPEPRARRAELHKRRSTIGRSQRGSEHVEHGEDDANLRPPSEASGVDDTFWRMASRRDNPHGGSCVCAAEPTDTRLSGPRDPTDRCGPRPKDSPPTAGGPGRRDAATQLGWPLTAWRGVVPLELPSVQARRRGSKDCLSPWPTAVRRPHGPKVRSLMLDEPSHPCTRVRKRHSPEGQRHQRWLCS